MKKRESIPRPIRRQLLIEAGYRCSVPHCSVDSALEFHHIDGDPSNNTPENLIVLCSNHHVACDGGRIDAKACRQIKNAVSAKETKAFPTAVSAQRFRKIIREELTVSGVMPLRINPRSSLYPSVFDRRYLFGVLRSPSIASFETYAALRILGEIRPRGATSVVIKVIQILRKQVRRGNRGRYLEHYRAAIRALSQIGTRTALAWLADEFGRQDQDGLHQFLIYLGIASCENSARRLGFRILGRNNYTETGKEVSEITFRMRGKKFRLKMNISRMKEPNSRSSECGEPRR